MHPLISTDQIERRVREMAAEISRDHPLGVHLVCVLKGACIFLSDLARALDSRPVEAGEIESAVDAMHRRLDDVLSVVPSLASQEKGLRAAFANKPPAPRHITHPHNPGRSAGGPPK